MDFAIILMSLCLAGFAGGFAMYGWGYHAGYHQGHADRHEDGNSATYTHPKSRGGNPLT